LHLYKDPRPNEVTTFLLHAPGRILTAGLSRRGITLEGEGDEDKGQAWIEVLPDDADLSAMDQDQASNEATEMSATQLPAPAPTPAPPRRGNNSQSKSSVPASTQAVDGVTKEGPAKSKGRRHF